MDKYIVATNFFIPIVKEILDESPYMSHSRFISDINGCDSYRNYLMFCQRKNIECIPMLEAIDMWKNLYYYYQDNRDINHAAVTGVMFE